MKRSTTRLLYLVIFCMLFSILHSQRTAKDGNKNSTVPKTISIENNGSEIRRYWISAEKGLKVAMAKLIKTAMPTVLREVYSRNVSSDCLNGLLHFSTALRKAKLWAFKMLDANGKLPEGFLYGTLSILGDYNECVDIDVKEGKMKLKGQYCTVIVSPPLPEWRLFHSIHQIAPELINISAPDTVITYLSEFLHNLRTIELKFGLCLPSLCNKYDIQSLIQIVPDRSGLDWKFNVHRCEVKEDLSFNTVQKTVLSIFGILAFLIASGTIAGMIWDVDTFPSSDRRAKILQYLLAFSVFSNMRKLSSYSGSHDHLRFVHGLMFICIFWNIISNTFMYLNYHISANLFSAIGVIQLLFFEILLNRTLPIQTFFFLSGFVAAYKWMSTPEENISIWKYIFKRYWRYTPTYLLMIGLIMLTPTWGSGPSWLDQMMSIYDKCYNNWWANILYINNFFDMESSCLEHTWVFAVDAQLHLLGLLILIPLKRRPTVGIMLNFILLGLSLLTVALTNVYYDIPPTELLAFLSVKDRVFFSSHTYCRVYTHFCMYCTGIYVGYFLAEKPKFSPPKWLSCVAWPVVLVFGLSVMCVIHVWTDGILPTPLIGAVYASLGKAAWAAMLAWIAVNCASGNGGAVNDFLSWRPFAFFSRLAFVAYIVHPVLIEIATAIRKTHMNIEQFELLYTVMSHEASTLFLSFLCFLAFEAPFLSITDVIRKRFKSSGFGDSSVITENTNVTCNAVMTVKPMKYEEKRKQGENNRTKC